MKRTILIIILLCLVGKADCRVSHKELKKAKRIYLYEKWLQHEYGNKTITDDLVSMDSLTYEGLKIIYRSQHWWIIKK